MPLENSLVSIDNTDEESPIVGAGITWDVIEGRHAVTVELNMRGMEPMHFSVVENDTGEFNLILPEVKIQRLTEKN